MTFDLHGTLRLCAAGILWLVNQNVAGALSVLLLIIVHS